MNEVQKFAQYVYAKTGQHISYAESVRALEVTKFAEGQTSELAAPVSPIDPKELAKVDFIEYPDDVKNGSTCHNCRYSQGGICTYPTIHGQPVTERNCCGKWDAPGTKRPWQKRMVPKGLQHKEESNGKPKGGKSQTAKAEGDNLQFYCPDDDEPLRVTPVMRYRAPWVTDRICPKCRRRWRMDISPANSEGNYDASFVFLERVGEEGHHSHELGSRAASNLCEDGERSDETGCTPQEYHLAHDRKVRRRQDTPGLRDKDVGSNGHMPNGRPKPSGLIPTLLKAAPKHSYFAECNRIPAGQHGAGGCDTGND